MFPFLFPAAIFVNVAPLMLYSMFMGPWFVSPDFYNPTSTF